jgi:hypothetical protein
MTKRHFFQGVSALALAALVSGCSTIYFHRGSQNAGVTATEWHHDGIARLVEFSPPVDMADRCVGNPWTTVKVEKSFVQVLASSFSYSLYDPWDVSYACKGD